MIARILLAIGLCAASVACGGTAPNPTVTILIPWDRTTDAAEYNAFNAVISRFKNETHINVVPQVTRGATQELDADLTTGDLPDVADLANPGAIKQYIRYKGKPLLRPLKISLGDYAQPWRNLATVGTGTVYTVPVKVDVQSLLWYSTSAVKSPPKSWTAVQSLSQQRGTPWCLGLASGVVSGWPGADWIADIFLSRYQVGNYEDWLHGTLAWNLPQVSYAWQEWGTLMRNGNAVPKGVRGALTTPFKQAMPGVSCEAEHGSLIATGLPSTAGYGYVPFPSQSGARSPALVSGDFMGLFTDNPYARQLLNYLASREAQTLWVRQLGGDAFSADQKVRPADYPPGVRQHIAGLLQPGAGITLCFAAGDVMVPDMSNAFWQAVLEYVNDPRSLHDLLGSLQRTQQGAGKSPVWNLACSGRS